jgi:hypothetical protein
VPIPQTWLLQKLLSPVLRPATRFIIGFIAIPLLRLVRKKVVHTKEWDDEFEKDIEQWFRASALLFFATKNVEVLIGYWLDLNYDFTLNHWYVAAGRLLLAIGVIEAMPDQELFAIVHPGPPKPTWDKSKSIRGNISPQVWPIFRGLVAVYLKRSSPVLAITAAIFGGTPGWVCFWMAIVQYLVIGLVTSRDKAIDVLSEFDKQIAIRRQRLIEEFQIDETQPAESETSAVITEEMKDNE